ncbi:MAG: hypothetical protein CR994_06780 [Maribacter sp.]|nr:MAG: hypothetical protein CR994_06780 [Maribacter sp.]
MLRGQIYLNGGLAVIGRVELEVSQSFNPTLNGTFKDTWTEFTAGAVLGARASPVTAADIQAGVRVNFTRFHPTKGLITVFH